MYQHAPDPRPALDPRVNYLLVNMLEDVLRYGTGAAVRQRGFDLPAAGKTGTSRDGWFAGFTTELLCVVWVGYDDGHDLDLEGARSALPIWTEFMKRAARYRPYGDVSEFQPPAGVVTVSICGQTGKAAGPDCPDSHRGVFVDGTQPPVESLHVVDERPSSGSEAESDRDTDDAEPAPAPKSADHPKKAAAPSDPAPSTAPAAAAAPAIVPPPATHGKSAAPAAPAEVVPEAQPESTPAPNDQPATKPPADAKPKAAPPANPPAADPGPDPNSAPPVAPKVPPFVL